MIERPEQLREAREAAGLSVSDIAQRLRLSVRHIEALEAGDWAALPGAAFARASLRSYARLLGVPVQTLLEHMPQAIDPQLLRPATRLDARIPQGSSVFGSVGARRRRWMLLAWGCGLLVLLTLATLIFQPSAWDTLRQAVRAREGSSPAPVDTPRAAASAVAPPAAGPGALSAETPAKTDDATLAAAATSPAPTPAVGQSAGPGAALGAAPIAAPAAAPAAAPSDRGSLLIRTQQDSWVEIRDARDRVIHMGIVRPADPIRLELTGPVTYTVGNARETRLEWSGRLIDLSGQIKPGTSIAKGSLP
jgi:cytoskeleton protein RodZ